MKLYYTGQSATKPKILDKVVSSMMSLVIPRRSSRGPPSLSTSTTEKSSWQEPDLATQRVPSLQALAISEAFTTIEGVISQVKGRSMVQEVVRARDSVGDDDDDDKLAAV